VNKKNFDVINLIAILSGPLLSLVIYLFGSSLNLTSKTLLFLCGALIPLVRLNLKWAFFVSIENFLLLNFFFTPPVQTFHVTDKNDFVTLLVFFILSVGLASAINNKGIYSPEFNLSSNQALVGNWVIDFEKEIVYSHADVNVEQHLTPIEWRFLKQLFQAKGKIVEQTEILHMVWGENYERESHYLRLFMRQLRKKLEPIPSKPEYLITEPGRGYRLVFKRPE
jgi:DNA-binding winged helix-turn-helix (wHTH) protein